MDHLKLLRRQKKLRREEEERRAARSDPAVPSTSTNNEARLEPRPDPAVARRLSSKDNNNNGARPTYKAAAPQQLESQSQKKQAPVSTLAMSPPSPATRKRPRALETDPVARVVRDPQVTKKELFARPTFGTAAPPKEVLDKNSYASPASSVSFSQSPSKEATALRKTAALKLAPPPAPPPARAKRAPAMYRNFGARDDSSSEEEDEDLFAFAQALEAKKQARKESPLAAVAAVDTTNERATTKPSSIPLRNGNYNGRNNDKEDIVQASRRLEAHRNQQQQNPMDVARNDDNDDDDGFVGTPSPTNADKPTTPRNPIARAKENAKPFFQVSPPAMMGGDDLFDDDDEEEEETAAVEDAAPGEKKKQYDIERPKKKRNSNPSNKTRERTTTNNNLFPTAEDVLDKDTAALQAELKPDFERPKFGPFVFDPLRLVAAPSVTERPVGVMGPDAGDVGDDEDAKEEFEVPASINRFLPNYQQEGIRFLFDLVSSRRGGILGDDMGVGTFWLCVVL
jgi:hypothetical protein